MAPQYNRDQRLSEADPKALGQRVPLPLHERIDELCDLLYDAKHARPTKVKMLAALVLAAPVDTTKLNQMLRRYDAATVADALVAGRAGKGKRVAFPERKPGRPRSPRPR